jgi:hypothetical protein
MRRTYDKPLVVHSPYERSKRARDAQWLLEHNRFKADYLTGKMDGQWGPQSGLSADRARFYLGYPQKKVKTGRFGTDLYDFLRTDKKHKKLAPLMVARRKKRLAELKKRSSGKTKALGIALSYLGVNENPPYSNRVMFSYWYGYIGPWCAMFTSYCLKKAGVTRVPVTALAYWYEWQGRSRNYGLSITSKPEPGDIVVYHINQGHVGFFKRWVGGADFEAVEGNTSLSSNDDGGEVMIRRRNVYTHNAVFVRVGV